MIVHKVHRHAPADTSEEPKKALYEKSSESAVPAKEGSTGGVGLENVHLGNSSNTQSDKAPFTPRERASSAVGQEFPDDVDANNVQSRAVSERSIDDTAGDDVSGAVIGGGSAEISDAQPHGPSQDDGPMSSGSPRRTSGHSTDGDSSIPRSEASQFTGASAQNARPVRNDGSPDLETAVSAQSNPESIADVPPYSGNATPTDISFTGGSVAENSAGGTVVATMEAVDADADDNFTYSLVGGDTDLFEVQDNQIVVRDGAVLDFENAKNHSVTVQVTDSAGNTYAENLDIAVQDVAENVIAGTGRADVITGTAADETMLGFGGNDVLNGAGGNDVIDGHRGADKLIGGTGDDDIDGGSGNDTLYGGDGNDVIYGGNAVNGKNAEIGGDDTLFGQVGDDLLDGGDGNDAIFGGVGDDVLIGGIGADDLDGGDGSDTASYAGSNAGVAVNLATGTASGGHAAGDTLTNIENVIGSDHADMLVGDTGNNTIIGGAGDDVIRGNRGDDTLDGGAGDDTFEVYGSYDGTDQFHGGDGTDTVRGFNSNDTIRVTSDLSNLDSIEEIDGGGGFDTVLGTAGDDTLDFGASDAPSLTSIERIDAGYGDDTVIGTDGDDVIRGNRGDDTLDGGAGDDQVFGDAGDDLYIFGAGDGSDQFDGGSGWTDSISLQGGSSGGPAFQGWTLQLDDDSHIEAFGDGQLDLSADAAGMITFDDGSELIFSGVDQIEW